MTARLMVFLDDGGVMNDNNTRALQSSGLRSWGRAVLVRDLSLPRTGTTVHIESLVELPALLQRLD